MSFVRALALFMFLLALPASAQVMEVGGVKFDDRAKLGNSELVLNGVGLRTRLMFKIYAIGLYLPAKTNQAQAAITAPGAKRVHIVTLRELSGEQLADALVESLRRNVDKTQLEKLEPRIQTLRNTMLAIGSAPERSQIRLDYLPGTGTRITLGNEQKGADIPGEDFYQALLRIWLGDDPVQGELRERLLGA